MHGNSNNKPFMVMKWLSISFFCYVEKVHDYFWCSLVANEWTFFLGFPLKRHMIGIITWCLSWLLKSGPWWEIYKPMYFTPNYKSICHMASFINYVFISNFELLLLGVESVDWWKLPWYNWIIYIVQKGTLFMFQGIFKIFKKMPHECKE
jgi:hypothetical protein